MAHYAFIDDKNVVVEVIVGRNEDEIVDGVSDWETYYSEIRGLRAIRTSYNNNIRKQYAGIGYTYDPIADVFITPQPFPSWTLDANHDWQPPKPRPEYPAAWDEAAQEWVEVSLPMA